MEDPGNKRKSDRPAVLPWHRRRFVRVGATVLASIIVIATVLLATFWPFTQARVAEALQQTFAGKITYSHYRSIAFPHPGVIAENVVLHRADASADPTPLVTVQRLIIQATYHDLIFRPKYVSRIILEGLRIHIPLNPDNTPQTDTSASHTRVGELIANDAILEIARRSAPLIFAIHSLKLTALSENQPFAFDVAVRNPIPPGEVHGRGRFGPWNAQDPAQTPFSGDYSFDNADLSVFGGIAGKLWSTGQFNGTLGQLQAQGNVDIPDFEVRRARHAVPVKTAYHAIVNATNGDVQLEQVDGLILQTKVLAKGSVAAKPGQHGKTASIDLTVRQGHIQDVLRLFVKARRPPLNGQTDFRAHVNIPPGQSPFLKKVVLVGDFGVQGGQFTKPETQQDIAKLSETGAGEKPKQNDDPDLSRGISELSGHVELRGGSANFSNFSFNVPDAEATMHGTYNLINEKVDLHGTLRTTAKFSNTVSGLKSVLLQPFNAIFKRKHHEGAKVPVQLTGTYDKPHAGLDIIK